MREVTQSVLQRTPGASVTVFNYKAIIGNSGLRQTKDTLRTGAQASAGPPH